MNAALAECSLRSSHIAATDIAVVLLGTGVVGGAFLKLLDTPAAASLRLVGAAHSRRQQTDPQRLTDRCLRERLSAHGDLRDDAVLLAALDASGAAQRVIVDATASAEVARRHPHWLAAGYDVVTANKAAAGGVLSDWQALQKGQRNGGSVYGDAATVGAGLPVLSTLCHLRACGDVLFGLEGVFSGSLSWLFNRYDGRVRFSALLHEAHALGYSEPDPRADLSGQDVARKLLILARSAGLALEADAVEVENLVPEGLRHLDAAHFLDRSKALDAPMAVRLAEAAACGGVLRYLARLDRDGHARVGLCVVPPTHPAARLTGTDNQFALTTARYATRPLVIQGPGAGADVTAQALLGDILTLPRRRVAPLNAR
jgi:aspartokinase/homoserine dehydrogenase 1